jgi:hypothetical protein
MTPIVLQDWRTLRECDEAAGAPKGTAFRAFKAQRARWREGHQYLRLDRDADRDLIAQLHHGNRLYASSVHAVLISPEAASNLVFDGR